jgi:hypothetical protein
LSRTRLSVFVASSLDGYIAHLDPMPFGGRPDFVFTHRPPQPRYAVTFWQESPRTTTLRDGGGRRGEDQLRGDVVHTDD